MIQTYYLLMRAKTANQADGRMQLALTPNVRNVRRESSRTKKGRAASPPANNVLAPPVPLWAILINLDRLRVGHARVNADLRGGCRKNAPALRTLSAHLAWKARIKKHR